MVVLNGVNLDVLGRRDPKLYGGLSSNELETRIYEWARELELIADCRQTNSEGEYVDWCHDAFDWADGVIVNPGAWTHYSYAIRDALELFDGAGRRGAPVEHRRARGVAAPLGDRRPRRTAHHRQGARRLPRGARVPGGEAA